MNQAGTYSATLIGGELGKSSTGTLQAAVRFSVTHLQDGSNWIELEPFERTVYLYLSPKARKHTQDKLATLGYTELKFEEVDGKKVMTFSDEAYKEAVPLKCGIEEYNGEKKERWDFASWGGGGAGEPLDDDDLLKLQAVWGT